MTLFFIILTNFLVGLSIGLTGIGFMLPLLYIAFFHFSTAHALSFSFSSFFVSGILCTRSYKKNGNLNLRIGIYLSIGSLVGAILGVLINQNLPGDLFKTILYWMVLLSGCSVLFGFGVKKKTAAQNEILHTNETTYSTKQVLLYILIGFLTATICAAAGAGGPILVMPILSILGFPAHTTIGIALFNSIFVALPAAPSYLLAASKEGTDFRILPLLLLVYGIGAVLGGKYTVRINPLLLKKIIAAASIAIALYKLICG